MYRIRKLESDPNTTLHAILALNPMVIEQAKAKDRQKNTQHHPIFGMPILLKDNINTQDMPTTAGAAFLQSHLPDNDAYIVSQLQSKGALILGKVNLSEWAYYFCDGCPLGYSAVGGQTLNPYGRKVFESGGSSSGSGVAVAANYAVAAVGSETSGSILSPSGHNAVVGCKPTIGLVSRTGIVPISSTLDTAGPMTKNVIDNAILLDAMQGKDTSDPSTTKAPDQIGDYIVASQNRSISAYRLGAIKSLVKTDSLYRKAINTLRSNGAIVVEFDPPNIEFKGFLSLLNKEMKNDLPNYFSTQSNQNFADDNVQSVVAFNQQDSLLRMPYGQGRLMGVIKEDITDDELQTVIDKLHKSGVSYFRDPMMTYNLDAVLTINNYHAAYAAVAFYPCLTVPMGYNGQGEPKNLTFVAESFSEPKPVDTYQNVLKCSTGGRIRASPKRTKTETPLLSLLDKEAFSLDSISELDLKGDFMLDMTRGGGPPPMKKRKFSPTPKRFKSEPIPPLSLEHTVMLVSAVLDDERNIPPSSKTVSDSKPHFLTDETIENLLRCV